MHNTYKTLKDLLAMTGVTTISLTVSDAEDELRTTVLFSNGKTSSVTFPSHVFANATWDTYKEMTQPRLIALAKEVGDVTIH